MIRLSSIDKRFAGHRRPLLRTVDLRISAGETFSLIGPGASGKSVLLKLMCGLLKPDRGQVYVDGLDVSGAGEDALAQVRAKIGMLFQNNALFDFMTVGE